MNWFPLLALFSLFPSFALATGQGEISITREPDTQFPRCLEFQGQAKNTFFKWDKHTLTRTIQVSHSKTPCQKWQKRLDNIFIGWKELTLEELNSYPEELQNDLTQVALKSNVLRDSLSAEDYLKENPIQEYTKELNRELTAQYGNIFSAQVFKAWIESKPRNKNLRTEIVKSIRESKHKELGFPHLKDKITLVVSFGLGWNETYSKITPFYIADFLADMKSMGLPVVFLKKNPFGSIKNNSEQIVPELADVLNQGKDIIIVSLCKGTPEILSAEAEIFRDSRAPNAGRVLGHVNLSGMLSGTFFSDIGSSVIVPKILAPIMKILPFTSAKDFGRMVDALKFIDSQTVENVVHTASATLPSSIFYLNVTGAPMSDRVLKNGSPMASVVRYNFLMKALKSANDGFIELPNTLIPESFSSNQATLVLDSTHLLADGYLEELEISDQATRRALYYSIVNHIKNLYPDLNGAAL